MLYIIFTIFLDILLSLSISVGYQNINIFFPLLIVGSFPVFYHFIKNKYIFFISIFVIGLIYDLLFSEIFLLNTYYFLLYSFFIYVFYNNNTHSIINILLISIIGTIGYDVFIFFVLILINYSLFNIGDLVYKIERTILVNFVYTSLSILCLKSRIFDYKKRKNY